MPQNLFVACRTAAGLVAKRVRLDQAVQQQVEGIFNQQEADFRDGITSEVAFDGSWTPDEDEFLTIDIPQEAAIFVSAINANPVSIPDINTANIASEGIKAIFTGVSANGATKVLVQRFSASKSPLLPLAGWQRFPPSLGPGILSGHGTYLRDRRRQGQIPQLS